MNLRHFFEGMLKREEIASAFLATLLENDDEFRKDFLTLALGDPSDPLLNESWEVTVESERIDVQLVSPTGIVLIENKINSGAKQEGQLLRYYLAAIQRAPSTRVVAVYLAPGGIGRDEVERVEACCERASRPDDVVRHVSWEAVSGLHSCSEDNARGWFAKSGFEQILAAIQRARDVKYQLVGGRDIVRGIAKDALARLAPRVPDITLWQFSSRIEEVITRGTGVTMWLHAVFQCEEGPPFAPIGVVQPDGIHLKIRTACKLAGRVKSTTPLAHAWRQLRSAGQLDVPGIGPHALEPSGWFAFSQDIVGTPEQIAETMANAGESMLIALRPMLALGDA